MENRIARQNLHDKAVLDDLNETLLAKLAAPPLKASEFGTLEVSATAVRVNCLGFGLVGERRLVTLENRFHANEYAFRTSPGLGSHLVCCIYLNIEAALCTSIEPRRLLKIGYRRPGEFERTAIPLHMAFLEHIAERLSRSIAFAVTIDPCQQVDRIGGDAG